MRAWCLHNVMTVDAARLNIDHRAAMKGRRLARAREEEPLMFGVSSQGPSFGASCVDLRRLGTGRDPSGEELVAERE
ncbi:hypothetical protein LuPra_02583 [Luteitalea pratensis]|uniref:Uncharacterized protein n=1 Tax=Luteitalea pratensis TaxID=1855912 RepID=A0A143PMQ8_LUTPR|nr:hypothetical protein LuPra_02583 [Luteitalea pratensis]